MDFALIFEGQIGRPSKAAEQEMLRAGIDQAVLADQLGFDKYYCVEHHSLEGYAHSSAPEVLLGAIAARTERIRVCHGVACLPFKMNHPVRVAERAAMLDVVSNGRMELGVGRSSSIIEQSLFGIDPKDTHAELEHSLRAIVNMWTEPEAEYHSDILDIPKRPVRPQPVQDPHPPLALACTRQDSLVNAGKWGLAAISNGVDGPNQAKIKRAVYDEARKNRQPGDLIGKYDHDRFGASVFTTILDDPDEAKFYGMRGLRYFLEIGRYYFANKGERPNPDLWTDHEENVRRLNELTAPKSPDSGKEVEGATLGSQGASNGVGLANSTWSVDFMDKGTTAFGSVDDTIQFVENMEAAGVDEAMFCVQIGGVPLDVVNKTIEAIGTKVIPHFRKTGIRVIDLAAR